MAPSRCERHGLATGPGGACALCRREARAGPDASSGRLRRALSTLALAAAGLAMAGLLIGAPGPSEPRPAAVAAEPVASPGLAVPTGTAGEALGFEARLERWQRELDREAPGAGSSRAPATLSEPTPALPAGVAARADEPAELRNVDPVGRSAAAGSAPTMESPRRASERRERELAGARQRVPVTVYYTNWCPHCRRARAYLRSRGIAFAEYDVEANVAAKSRLRLLNPRGGVPTIDVGGEILVGFSQRKLSSAIDRAARRSLGL